MARDIKVKNWTALLAALYDIRKNKRLGRYRSDFVYRGVASKSWGLDSSLMRLGSSCEKVEEPLLRRFAKYAQPGEIRDNAKWFLWALAQHHGLPTRLMDWSLSPKVAAHFATYEEEHYDEDGAIWCVDVKKVRDLLPERFKKTLVKHSAFLFTIEMLQQVKRLDRFKDFSRSEFVLFFEPPSLDARIVNQAAVMSVMPKVSMDLQEFLGRPKHRDLYHRIIIPKTLKWEIRDKLDQDNVTERMLFPGLDGLSRWLRRYYGPGPTVKPAARKKLSRGPRRPV